MLGLWSQQLEQDEHVPDLQHPTSVTTYRRMARDSAIVGVTRALETPLGRYAVHLDPNGADETLLRKLSEDLNVPILGDDSPVDRPRNGGRFTYARHRRNVALARRYGNMWFEQVMDEDTDGTWRLKKLAPRMPQSINKILLAADGNPIELHQGTGPNKKVIPITRALGYVWDQEPGEWYGTSLLRPMYAHWLIKHVLMRVDTVKHERNGMGVPIATEGPNPGAGHKQALLALASALRVGEDAAGTLPHGAVLELLGVKGTLPDTIGSIEYHDRMISRSGLAMFMDLGSTETGSRALGESFIDVFSGALDDAASWETDIFNEHMIEDYFTWNLGADARCPRIVTSRVDDPELQISDLALLVERGIVSVDPELEAQLRKRHRLPAKPEATDEEVPVGPSYAYDLDGGVITVDERRAQLGQGPHPSGLGNLTLPEMRQALGIDVDPLAAAAPAEVAARAGIIARTWRRIRGAAGEPASKWTPAPQIAAAGVDYDGLDELWQDATEALLVAWEKHRVEHIDELVASIIAAGGDLETIAAITATTKGVDTLLGTMLNVAGAGADSMRDELQRQGATLAAATADAYETMVSTRAEVQAMAIAKAITQSAVDKAVALTSSARTPAEVGALVEEHLTGLSDRWMRDKLGEAVTGSLNEGRYQTAAQLPDDEVAWYPDETLDGNTCDECRDIEAAGAFATREEAYAAYGGGLGGYVNCLGGGRCRGSLVAILADERGATA